MGIFHQLQYRYTCLYPNSLQSPGTNAVGSTTDDYDYEKYIRGSKSHILKAVYDYKVSDETYDKMNDNMKREVYGTS